MKNVLAALLIILCCSFTWGQTKGPGISNQNESVFNSFDQDKDNLGRTKAIVRTGKIIDGHKHIWKEWNKNGVVEAANGKKYRVSKINFNAKNNWFEVNVHEDSTYTFDRRKVNKVVINDRTFINVEFPESQRSYVVEQIATGKDFMLIKKYDVEILYGSHDPMRGTTRDKYKLLDDYYLKTNEGLEKFSPKKSSITKLYGNNAKKIAAYAKKEKLSFKDDKELAQIITYANSL